MPPPSKRRKTNPTQTQEIKFDFTAREEYLTGFSKRKQARIKHAQEEAAKREKEERLRLRRELRQQRKTDLEAHVKEVNTLLRKANPDLSDVEDGTSHSNENEEWEGFEKPAATIQVINQEDEYVDEDKFTTVTIESVGISKEGFEKAGGEEEEEGGEKEEDRRKADGPEEKDSAKKRAWTQERPKSDRPKKRKQKFRYESKADRKAERIKISVKKKARAEARKGK